MRVWESGSGGESEECGRVRVWEVRVWRVIV